MKPEGFNRAAKRAIQRVAQSGVILRKGDDAPELGSVDRVRQTPRQESWDPNERPLDAESLRRERLRRAITLGWSFGLGLLAVAAVTGALVVWLRPILNREKDATERNRQAIEARVRKVSKFKAPTEDELLMLMRNALAVQTEAEVNALIRPGPLTPKQVIESLAALKKTDGAIVEESWLGGIDKNGLLLEGIEVHYNPQDRTKNRLAIFTPDDRGVWKMDFAAFARSVEPGWEKLLAKGTTSGVVRVWVVREHYYNGPFMNDVQWVPYLMASQDVGELMVGYCRRWSPQHRAMELMWEGADNSTVRATLEVRRVEGAERRQFEIARVLAEDWVQADHPFDEIMSGAK